MTDLFSPRRPDGRAEWRVIHDHAVKLPYGSDLSFDEIAKLLDTDDRSRAHRAVRRCNQQFTRENVPRILGNVRGTGYRVLRPSDYAPAALAYQVQARRKMTNAVDIMRAAPLNDMTPGQRDWAHKVLMVLVDNDLRLRTSEQWQSEAEKRLTELERRAGIQPVITVEAVED
jgi:hypothetical protein